MIGLVKSASNAAGLAFAVTVGSAMLAVGARPVGAQRPDRAQAIDTTFAFSGSGTVNIRGGAATVVVTGWDEPSIHLVVRGGSDNVTVDATSSHLTVEELRRSDAILIEVHVPRGVRVVASTRSGDVTLRSTGGDVDVQTGSGDLFIAGVRDAAATSMSGDLDVGKVAGTATLITVSGELSLTDAEGAVEATTVSGDLHIARSSSKVVRARSTAGAVDFDGTIAADGIYELVSHSGDVTLAVPRDAGAELTVTTWSGEIDSEFPITLKPNYTSAASGAARRFNFVLGSGSGRITAESFSGDIRIVPRGGR
jgi:DUF4097 and DUF4098 domain-containing protein YvlB